MKYERSRTAAKVKLPSEFSVQPTDVTACWREGERLTESFPSSAALPAAYFRKLRNWGAYASFRYT